MPGKLPVSLLIAGSLFAYSCSNSHANHEHATTPDSLDGKNAYTNPVDGQTYASDEKWQTYGPAVGVKQPEGPSSMRKVIFVTSIHELHDRIGIDTLTDYIKESEKLVLAQLKDTKDTGEMLIQFSLLAKKAPVVKLSSKGNLNQDSLNHIKLKLEESAKGYRTTRDTCIYQLYFLVNTKLDNSGSGNEQNE